MSQHIIDTRMAFYHCGIDYGSDAKVLLVKGMHRLVWAKATRTLIGIRGCGHVTRPCTLELRTFRCEGERITPDGSQTLLTGGRLSRTRLLLLAGQIDLIFGKGVAAGIDYRQTTIMGADKVMDWIDGQRKKVEEAMIQNVSHLRKQWAEYSNTSFDGIKL